MTIKNEDWLRFGRQNYIGVALGGIEVALRYTCHQSDCYRELIEEQKRTLEAEKVARQKKEKEEQPDSEKPVLDSDVQMAGHLARRVSVLRMDSIQVAMIALNPEPGSPAYPQEEIERLLDLDQIAILAQTWVDRKVFNPRLNPPVDPPALPRP